MNIDQLFQKYPDNLIGFRCNKGTKIVDFWFSTEWEFPKTNELEVQRYAIKKQKDSEDGKLSYYVLFSEVMEFSELYTVFADIVEYNLDIERKQKLFAQKMNDLKRLFVTLSYDELRSISFDSPLTLTVPVRDEPLMESEKLAEGQLIEGHHG